jgi:hypothetical protein
VNAAAGNTPTRPNQHNQFGSSLDRVDFG